MSPSGHGPSPPSANWRRGGEESEKVEYFSFPAVYYTNFKIKKVKLSTSFAVLYCFYLWLKILTKLKSK